jgi:DNA polymerase-1
MWQIGDADTKVRGTAERGSWNTPIQGTAHEFLLQSIVSVVDWITCNGVPARLCLPIHDALLLEIRDDCVDEVAHAVRGIMTGWPSGNVPMVVDIDVGPDWGHLERLV